MTGGPPVVDPVVVSARFRLRRDTAANWTAANPVLASAEPGIETDSGRMKFGDGSTAWTGLPYASQGWAERLETLLALFLFSGDVLVADGSDGWTRTGTQAFGRALMNVANAADARVGLELGDLATLSAPVDILHGGTGASTEAAARTALGLGGGVNGTYASPTSITIVNGIVTAIS